MSLLKERIIMWKKGSGSKKYKVIVEDKKTNKMRTLQFGHKNYQHYKDISPLKEYSGKNHLDWNRKRRFFQRHFNGETNKSKALAEELRRTNGRYTPKYLSGKYLW